ncbi:MAG: DinB family protein [Acidobacteriota bacterium]
MSTDPLIQDLSTLFLRDLDGLRREIELYPDDAAPWAEIPGLPNRGGTLALHLAGNLRHFVGTILGGSGYVRDRDLEFSARDVPRADLLAKVATARQEVEAGLAVLDPSVLDKDYPLPLGGRTISTRQFLIHLAVHLTFHLGQIDYHRRASTGDATSAGVIPLSALGRAIPAG